MCDDFKTSLISYLREENIHNDEDVWDIVESEKFGRCLIAKRDLHPNEIIFKDKALFFGPRDNVYKETFCICCLKTLDELNLCGKCETFALCDECGKSSQNIHQNECNFICTLKSSKPEMKFSKDLLRALTLIRGFTLDEKRKKIMWMMAYHENATVEKAEIDRIMCELDLTVDCAMVKEFRHITSIMNTNAFEIPMLKTENSQRSAMSLRGLFVLGAMMNHNCVPNIRYSFDDSLIMTCKAAKLIKKGEQIFNSYTKSLWGTNNRRSHLYFCKKFHCECDRCKDPREFGSLISSIKCIRPGCDSVMLATNPLIINSHWKCEKCSIKLDYGRVSRIVEIASKQLFNKINTSDGKRLNDYFKSKLNLILPNFNQFIIEIKLQIIYKMQQSEEFNLEDQLDVIQYCKDILQTIDALTLGETFIKGMLLYRIANSRYKIAEFEKDFNEEVKREIKEKMTLAWEILKDSSTKPSNLCQLMALTKDF